MEEGKERLDGYLPALVDESAIASANVTVNGNEQMRASGRGHVHGCNCQ